MRTGIDRTVLQHAHYHFLLCNSSHRRRSLHRFIVPMHGRKSVHTLCVCCFKKIILIFLSICTSFELTYRCFRQKQTNTHTHTDTLRTRFRSKVQATLINNNFVMHTRANTQQQTCETHCLSLYQSRSPSQFVVMLDSIRLVLVVVCMCARFQPLSNACILCSMIDIITILLLLYFAIVSLLLIHLINISILFLLLLLLLKIVMFHCELNFMKQNKINKQT